MLIKCFRSCGIAPRRHSTNNATSVNSTMSFWLCICVCYSSSIVLGFGTLKNPQPSLLQRCTLTVLFLASSCRDLLPWNTAAQWTATICLLNLVLTKLEPLALDKHWSSCSHQVLSNLLLWHYAKDNQEHFLPKSKVSFRHKSSSKWLPDTSCQGLFYKTHTHTHTKVPHAEPTTQGHS